MEAIVGIWERNVYSPGINGLDLTGRLNALDTAVAALQAQVDAQNVPPGHLIKGIFVAPEYLFTAQYAGATRAVPPVVGMGPPVNVEIARSIPEADKNRILQHLIVLSRRHPRLLIVPGSIAWVKPLDELEAQRDLDFYQRHDRFVTMAAVVRQQLAWNTATNQVVIKTQGLGDLLFMFDQRDLTDHEVMQIVKEEGIGGPDMAGQTWLRYLRGNNHGRPLLQRAQITDKEDSVWNLVFDPQGKMMRNSCYVVLNGAFRFVYNKQGDFHENFGATQDTVFIPGAEKGFVEIEGIKFGIEICLDHNIGMLTGQSRATQIPDIHIISSAWVQQNPQNVRLRDFNGFLIHASSNPAECGVWQSNLLGLDPHPSYGNAVVAGSTLRYYRIDLHIADDEPLNLEQLFGAGF